ncbi:carboxypeptidase-like regulatory domain-containing protein [Anaerolineales bacterium HSG24]|nr:carboxypeptidase-like regulatory domain-containing protein [Anaerolineales bacterium HSG24]
MGLDHQAYNKKFLESLKSTGKYFDDATQNYAVEVVEADVAEGETYWRLAGIHHLLPRENGGNHHVYLDVLDENGKRIRPTAWIGWSWLGRRPEEHAPPIPSDKPDNEPGTNVVINRGQTIEVWVVGTSREAKDKSDMVKNLHANHPDEVLPDGAKLNTIGHHSFYVAFQRTKKTASDPIVVEPPAEIPQEPPVVSGGAKNSAISGKVTGGTGKTVLLIQNGTPIDRRAVSDKGYYRFAPLGAGNYTIQIENSTVSKAVQVDGTNRQIANLTLGDQSGKKPSSGGVPSGANVTSVPGKTIQHYVLLGPENSKTNLAIAASYILKFGLTVGFSVAEAKQASRVTIVGAGIRQADQNAIKSGGCQLEVLTDDAYDIEEELTARVNRGQAFAA